MGRIVKSFVAKTKTGHVSGRANVDSGADRTVLALPLACRLGLDLNSAPLAAMRVASGQRMVGFELTTDVQIDNRNARVSAFVPVYAVGAKNKMQRMPPRNLIGHDFLQRSGAQLDYAKPHAQVMSGTAGWPFEWHMSKVTAKERRALRSASCPRR